MAELTDDENLKGIISIGLEAFDLCGGSFMSIMLEF